MHLRLSLFIALTLLIACTSQQTTVLTEPIPANDSLASSSSLSSLSSLYSLSSLPSSVASESSVASVASTFSIASAPTPSSANPLPPSVRIDLPFASQAPIGDWGDPYQEACEEASLILVHHYLSKKPLDAKIMNQDILDLTAWETAQGLPQDITVSELAEVARGFYGYNADVFEDVDVTRERIERELAQGNPVIVPLAGQDIGNPYFSGDGPPYHMLVIVGYDAKNFLTHDVGTRHGEYYSYRKQVLMDAIHDWTGNKETIRSGEKRMMVVR